MATSSGLNSDIKSATHDKVNTDPPNQSANVMNSLTLRGRQFTKDELTTIQGCVIDSFNQGRTAISKDVCEKLNWRQPNGWLKDRACRDVLIHLEKLGIVKLPPSKSHRKENTVNKRPKGVNFSELKLALSPVTTFPIKISLDFAKGNPNEQLWNQLVEAHHYLGHSVIVGRCIKYLIKGDGVLLGAIAFSSPAWRLAPRDRILSKLLTIGEIRDLVINNSRFLILPNIRVPNLASAVLALATKKVTEDWAAYYSITPLIVETFVEPSRFQGTCYRAANWLEIGVTKGYAKKGRLYHNGQQPKQIFLYALSRPIRRQLSKLIRSSETR